MQIKRIHIYPQPDWLRWNTALLPVCPRISPPGSRKFVRENQREKKVSYFDIAERCFRIKVNLNREEIAGFAAYGEFQ